MRIGAHIPVSPGYEAAVAYAVEVGCECMQIFAKSPRQWESRPIDPETAVRFETDRSASGITPLFTHTAYLINLSTTDEALRSRSVEALADELVRGVVLGAAGVVTHIGTAPDGDTGAAAVRAADSIVRALEIARIGADAPALLLENTAGAGTAFGCCAEEFGAVFDVLGSATERIGVCLDTCHAHAHGIDLTSDRAWHEQLEAFERACGGGCVRLVHANDCMFERGSHRDRHAWIGDGTLGRDAFRAMLCEPLLADVCAITEMPGDPPVKDAENLTRLRTLRETCD